MLLLLLLFEIKFRKSTYRGINSDYPNNHTLGLAYFICIVLNTPYIIKVACHSVAMLAVRNDDYVHVIYGDDALHIALRMALYI